MKKQLLFLALAATIAPDIANAYVGPGAGLSAIGSSIALIFGLFVAILGFIWYPIKRLLRGKQGATLEDDNVDSKDAEDANGTR